MSNITLSITGFDELRVKLEPALLLSALSDSVDNAAKLLRDEAKKMAPVSAATTGYAAIGIPVDTGRMRQSIQYKKTGQLTAVVSADTDYSIFVQEGTKRMPPRPFFQWLLETGGQQKVLDLFNNAIRQLYS